MALTAPRMKPPEDESPPKEPSPPADSAWSRDAQAEFDEQQAAAPKKRNLLAFVCLGLLNNVVYAVSNASAGSVMPDAVALVYIVNTAPGLAIKIFAPLWIDLGSYTAKILLVAFSLAFNLFVLVLPGVPTWLKLLGIALGDMGSSAGEATCMGLTQFYAQPRRHISFFAFGTGCAGVSGWALKIFVLPLVGDTGSLVLGRASEGCGVLVMAPDGF